MFYNLTTEQIAKIKAKFYPQESTPREFLKRVILNNYGDPQFGDRKSTRLNSSHRT